MKNDKAKFFKMKYKSMLLSTLISYAFLTLEFEVDITKDTYDELRIASLYNLL